MSEVIAEREQIIACSLCLKQRASRPQLLEGEWVSSGRLPSRC